MRKYIECGSIDSKYSIVGLLDKKPEKHLGKFEIPKEVLDVIDIDEINAIIGWYLEWKLKEGIENQNTCRIKDLFGTKDGNTVITVINLYKFLRNKKM